MGLFHTLSGGFKDSWIFYAEIWGFMIQFDLPKPPNRCLMAASEHSLHPKKGGCPTVPGVLNKNLTKDCNISQAGKWKLPSQDQLWKDAVLMNLKSNPVVFITFWRVIPK